MPVLLAALLSRPLFAADPPGVNPERAQVVYKEALKLYRSGQYRAAIEKLNTARKLDPSEKNLPYNLGIVHEKLGELDDAIKNFEIYFELETDKDEKERVQVTIQRLRGARDEINRNKPAPPASAPASSSAPPPEPPPPPPPPPPPRKGRLDALVYGTGGLALAATGAGIFFGVTALSRRPDLSTASNKTLPELQNEQKMANSRALFADLSFGVAIASGGAAVLLYLLRDAPPEASASSGYIAPTQGGGLVGWSGKFLGASAGPWSGVSLGFCHGANAALSLAPSRATFRGSLDLRPPCRLPARGPCVPRRHLLLQHLRLPS